MTHIAQIEVVDPMEVRGTHGIQREFGGHGRRRDHGPNDRALALRPVRGAFVDSSESRERAGTTSGIDFATAQMLPQASR